MQLRILRLRLLQDGNVRISILPQRQEILIRRAGFGSVALQLVSAGEAETCQCAPSKVHDQSPVVNELLKFCSRLVAAAQREIGFPVHINRYQKHCQRKGGLAKFSSFFIGRRRSPISLSGGENSTCPVIPFTSQTRYFEYVL